MKRLIVLAVLLLLAPFVRAQAPLLDWQDSPQLDALFREAGASGTFVLYDVEGGRLTGHDLGRANTQYIPASTFKIPNTLIGLASGAVKDVDEVLPYGGAPQPVKAWERDMSLREAIALSNVAIYRELARRIGLEPMRDAVERLHYGNRQVGDSVDGFWLVGPLKISAVEQVQFLAKLAREELPYPKVFQGSVREILRLEQGEGWTLYGKTGWVNYPGPGIGWWVGWVQKGERLYPFALAMDMHGPEDGARRLELGRACLRALGVL